MAIANELSGEVAVAVLALAASEEQRDKTELKQILVSFYSALRPLTTAARRKHTRPRAMAASASNDKPAAESA